MTLLDIITKASANADVVSSQEEYPIFLNPDEVFTSLKPEVENPAPSSLVSPLSGWKISSTDAGVIELSKKFFAKLKRKLKDTNSFNREEFIEMLSSFLQKIGNKVGISNDNALSVVLVEKVGFLMGRDVSSLVLEACLGLEIWELVEGMIKSGLVDHSCYSTLVPKLASKNKTDLLCLCTKHASDLGSSELLCILKYFLNPPKGAYGSMANVRKEWEDEALLAIERANDEKVFGKKPTRLAKEAAILLMVAYDGFSDAELCLHYLLKSSDIDDVILAYAIGKLNGKEMVNLIRYLGKWLKKYERFPQAVECPKTTTIGLKACDWVPKLEDIAKCLGIVLDQNFSSLVLHPEFHKELKSIEEVVSSLAFEAKFCCLMANIVEKLKAGAPSLGVC